MKAYVGDETQGYECDLKPCGCLKLKDHPYLDEIRCREHSEEYKP